MAYIFWGYTGRIYKKKNLSQDMAIRMWQID